MYYGDVGGVSGGSRTQWEPKRNFDGERQKFADNFNKFREEIINSYKKTDIDKEWSKFDDASQDERARINKEYAQAMSEPWIEVTVEPPVQAPVFEDKGPVYYTEPPVEAPVTGPKEGENPAYDAVVKPAMSDAEIATVHKENTPQESSTENYREVNAAGISIKYDIQPGKEGKGFDLKLEGHVSGRNGDAFKFFSGASVVASDDKNKIKKDSEGNYTFRGMKSKSLNILQKKINMVSTRISANHTIYKDLSARQKSGEELTQAERNFMKFHLKSLDRYMLGMDDNGNLTDKLE